MPAAVRRYLEQLEQFLKQQMGVLPEEALSDAREHLISSADALARSGEGPGDDELYAHFVGTFGEPSHVAEQYADGEPSGAGGKPRARLMPWSGYAPGWRICCTKCGRSAPLSALGGVRIGARSVHKYTVGWCRQCGWLRWLRIIRDLDGTNVVENMGMTKTPEQSLRSMHRPVATVVGIVLATLVMILATFAVVALTTRIGRGQDASAPAATKRLREAIDQNYSHRDRKGVDWNARFAAHQKKLDAAAGGTEFAAAAAELLSVAEDGHLWLKVGDRIVPTYRRDVRPNINLRVLQGLIPTQKQHGKTVVVGQFADGIRYVGIWTWDHREPASLDAAVAAVSDAAKAKAPLIIDVRLNGGGDEIQARRIAAFFVAQPTVYAKHVIHRAGQDQPMQERRLLPAPDGVVHPGPCVVLMGPANVSSCEAFLGMMRAAGCRLIGEKSGGSSGNPQPVDLGNGVTAYVPSWRALDSAGQPLEGVGITPDITVATKAEDFQRGDPVLVRALEVLQKNEK
jgi:hypothetical protein